MRHYQSNPAKLKKERAWAKGVDTLTIMDKLESSNERNWRCNPEYFQAIYSELSERLIKY